MDKTKKRRIQILAASVFWLGVWQAAAVAIGQEVFLVSPVQAIGTLVELLPQAEFWQRIGFSAGRILLGFGLGVLSSAVLAVAAEKWEWVDALLAPVMQLVKATPVASFIILALVLAQVITKHLVQPITRMAEHLDCIEANVPYEELIPLAHTVQSDRKLREDNETIRREFTANVSHELKTPLTSISGYAELIENGMAKQEDIPTFGHRIHKEAQRMITLVSDILQLSELDGMSKQQENSPTADFVPVDLGVLVKDVATNMTVNARKAYITLQYKVQPVTVRGSHDLLTELVTNLCDNAIRYNRPGGHVELSCGTNADGCPYFCVEDNGIGIPQDSQSRVFERFYRVDKSHSKEVGGTGLGLSIVKHAAQYHGAKIELKSDPGKGTAIAVNFTAAK